MAKYSGVIGFVKDAESFEGSGVWTEQITEKHYYGDVIFDHPKWDEKGTVVDGIDLNNKFSVVMDSFAKENLGYMRYITYGGVRWRIKTFELMYPRITIYVGGIYNGETEN